MARYEVQTPLERVEVLARAERFFGKRGLGLRMTEDTETVITWCGAGGMVSVSVLPASNGNTVEVAATEWDVQARQFLRSVRGSAWRRWLSAVKL